MSHNLGRKTTLWQECCSQSWGQIQMNTLNMRKLFVVICRKSSRLNCRCCTYRSLISKHFKVNKVTWCPNFVTNMIITTMISMRIICIYVTWIVSDIQRVCYSPCTSHADIEIIRNISQHVLKMSRSWVRRMH